MQQGETLAKASLKAHMDIKTARKYLKARKLPSTFRLVHDWRTREDVFTDVWDGLRKKLGLRAGAGRDDLHASIHVALLTVSFARFSAGSGAGGQRKGH